ncbi:pyridoxamine 5'-phosphate oxidase family protein [Capilliphycus salinus ALCB114379]|uniref:pyridoxamine 5'-phosphate oxidase family protein n=1 Tax=Capilliphycus salinus TaxID=2768948 RepID=UPI0039A571AF
MNSESPFHEGELEVQQRVGETQSAQKNGRIIASAIAENAIKFIEQQPMVILGSIDPQQNLWASVLLGSPDFVNVVNLQKIQLNLTRIFRNFYDPFWTNIQHDSRVGLLLIDLENRRRVRINGRIVKQDHEQLEIAVEESYPNCSKYIQRRHLVQTKSSNLIAIKRQGEQLEAAHKILINSSDTFFVVSAYPSRGVDTSHRGGNPGFVRVLDDKTLRIPDYVGNSMFNTLGNFAVNPRAGLVFLDFQNNRILQLTGEAEILWELDDPTHETGGTKRYWNFTVKQWLETQLTQSFDWEFIDYSPHNPS